MRLGELCKQKRQLYGLSQEDLADALGLSRYTIQKFEKGKNATLDTALKIANHFDLLDDISNALQDMTGSDDINSLY